MSATHRHLLDIEKLETQRIVQFLDTAEVFFDVSRRKIRKVPTLRGKTVINLFFEASTRTRTSFEIAGKRLSADVVNVSSSGSSVSKGETLLDTVKNLEAMQPDVIVMRHGSSGAPHFIAKRTRASVVNAGDGTHEHPTQALLDAFTIRRAKGRLAGLVVTITGDLTHSRVARSNAHLLTRLGATVRVCGPRTMIPPGIERLGVEVFDNFARAAEGADVLMMLRIQRERMGEVLFPTAREYSRHFGLNHKILKLAQPDAIVMHPGPMNRGVEIDPEIADGPQSVVLDQVEAGVAVRMAVLYLLAGEAGQSPLS
ncbi:MAG: aspartate carbamoyltransferase catalytic subunit [Deltaproteobacteria bacterium]|nr:aspartate carbamoyltransferase catalytic subunit [Deltaproteobacteria bacterium]